ncbi:MAG: class I SAM-dependent methyltransferase [Planctomycetota bacterium]
MEDIVYKEFLELEEEHWWFQGRRAIFISLLDRFCERGNAAGRRVMDVGCGVGGMLTQLEEYGLTIGTDVVFKGLECCAQRGYSRLVASHAPASPFLDGSFDCITAFDALEHIEDDVGTMREIFRMLKPGGILIASGPAYNFLFSQQDRNAHHLRRYTLGEITGKARSVGFEIEKASHINFLLFPVILPVVLLLHLRYVWNPKAGNPDGGSNIGIGIPKWLNALLAAVFRSEAKILRFVSIPAGHSLVMVARKPL